MKNCENKNCKHYKKSERIGIKVCEFCLGESYCEKDKEDFVIEELEKLKAEFEEDKYILLNQTVAIQIMDKHIAELKGGE